MEESQQDIKRTENKVSFRMEQELHLRLKLAAVREGKTIQEVLNGLALSYVKQEEAKGV